MRHYTIIRWLKLTLSVVVATTMLASCASQRSSDANEFTISILGTNDVHGELLQKPDRGGLVTISAYVDALRAARAEDNGVVLVIDAGDMWQGTLESNLVEGAVIVEAYNAIGVAAATIGNHEFDFGPVGSKAIPEDSTDDPRGALKLRATEANFPLLAANLIDNTTAQPVNWDNVRPSTIVDVNGVKVGIIGVISRNALLTTISANTSGLRIAPLAETIVREATTLRSQGAKVLVVTAHAGGRCTNFDSRTDTSSCNMNAEIMRVAQALPRRFVDHIIAGHVHQGIAHVVNGISITSSYSNTRAFSRVDLTFDRDTQTVSGRRVHAPQQACLSVLRSNGVCASPGDDPREIEIARYEGREISPNPEIERIAARAAAFARVVKGEKLGVSLEAAFEHPPSTESALANLMTEALLDSSDADIAIHNVVGGIRNVLPAGELTFGAVYEMFPFDNRVVVLDVTGQELRMIIAKQAHNQRRRAGFAGMRVFVDCRNDSMSVVMKRPNGESIRDDERIKVLVNDYLALGGDDILTPVIPENGFRIDSSMPLTRDVLLQWFRDGSDTLNPNDYLTVSRPKWNVPDPLPDSCTL